MVRKVWSYSCASVAGVEAPESSCGALFIIAIEPPCFVVLLPVAVLLLCDCGAVDSNQGPDALLTDIASLVDHAASEQLGSQ